MKSSKSKRNLSVCLWLVLAGYQLLDCNWKRKHIYTFRKKYKKYSIPKTFNSKNKIILKNHFFLAGAFSFLLAVYATTAFSTATTAGVYKACLLWASVLFNEPFASQALNKTLAIEPTTLNFSTTAAILMCFPSLGMPVMSLS